jgi:transposase
MIGREQPFPGKFFYEGFSLEDRVRPDHPLRAVKRLVDFSFSYQAVADKYGHNGNVSVPPPVILKLMFLLFFYDVASERELMATIPERLDWLWFLGYDLDDKIPDHSVLSKARRRWHQEIFKSFFVRVVKQCVDAGLVAGDKIFCDASLVNADASCASVGPKIKFDELYEEFERRLDGDDTGQRKYVSATDPDATVVPGHGGARPRYKEHRCVDGKFGVVTAVAVTAGGSNEAHQLPSLKDQHEVNTDHEVKTVVADRKYGTIANYLYCYDQKITPHLPDLKDTTAGSTRRAGIFPSEEFKYQAAEDVYICPAGERLARRRYHKRRDSYDYGASREVCARCKLRKRCTRAKAGRSVKRHIRQDDLELMREAAQSTASRLDLKERQHLAERSFADAVNNHGFKRARWRRLWRVQIQDYLITAIQNIRIMMKHGLQRAQAVAKSAIDSLSIPLILGTKQFVAVAFTFLSNITNTIAYTTKKSWECSFGQHALEI